jgi:hypothetical protein
MQALYSVNLMIKAITNLFSWAGREQPHQVARAGLLAEPAGAVTRVLADWCPSLSVYHLYFSRRQPRPAFALLVDALRYRG